MRRYILFRVIQAIVVILLVTMVVFLLVRLTGDPTNVLLPLDASPEDRIHLIRSLGLDRPVYIQYAVYLNNMLHGDFGISYRWKEPVLELVFNRLSNTLILVMFAMVFAVFVGIFIGTMSATKPKGWIDRAGTIFSILGQSMPTFWVGIILMLVFSIWLDWLSPAGKGGFQTFIMPVFTLGWYSTAAITRLTRSSMLDVMDSEYIKLAKLKGLPERLVVWKHSLKNSIIPVLTYASLQLLALLNGAVIVEMVFAWPGIGRLAVDAVLSRDFLVAQAVVFIISVLFVFANLIVDILYAFIDPRIRYS